MAKTFIASKSWLRRLAATVTYKQKMNKQEYIKSKVKLTELAILIIGAISAIFLGGYFVLNEVISLGISISIFGLYCIYILFSFDVIYINKDEVLIKSLTGITKKKIRRNTLKYYTEIEKENAATNFAKRKWNDLTLFNDSLIYKISSSNYSNYPEIKRILIRGLERNKAAEQEWERKNGLKLGYGLMISGLLLGTLIFRNGIPKNEIIGSVVLIVILLLPIMFGARLIKKNNKTSR